MNTVALLFLILETIAIFSVPRRLITIPFFIGCCYIPFSEGVIIAGASFPIVRIIILLALIRTIFSTTRKRDPNNKMDKLFFAWCACMFISSFFHLWEAGSGPKYITGVVLIDIGGFYILIRSLCQSTEELYDSFGMLCIVLLPIAFFMLVEQVAEWNVFSIFDGMSSHPLVRNGRLRAQGPFNHPILAGTIGATCVPYALAIWNRHRIRSIIGASSCVMMVIASASSGPIMSLLFVFFGMFLWKFPLLVKPLSRLIIPSYIVLYLVMDRAPYYLISRIDLTGSSTGWHRSHLIEKTMSHFSEWWLFGTDYTRHWMPGQGAMSANHTDITNQYIMFGVRGGLLSIVLTILLMRVSFQTISRLTSSKNVNREDTFLFWCIGSALFSHAITSLSISYFGQSSFFFWLPIVSMACFYNMAKELNPSTTQSQ
jgi:hypothetical protein